MLPRHSELMKKLSDCLIIIFITFPLMYPGCCPHHPSMFRKYDTLYLTIGRDHLNPSPIPLPPATAVICIMVVKLANCVITIFTTFLFMLPGRTHHSQCFRNRMYSTYYRESLNTLYFAVYNDEISKLFHQDYSHASLNVI